MFFIIFVLNFAYAQNSFFGSVKKIIDGDSLLIMSEGEKIEVRLYGIDCPEYDQKYSKQARQFVKKQVHKKDVTIYPEYHDSYGRLVAIVVYDGKILNQELLYSGYAWVYPLYCKKDICKSWKKIEKQAQKKQKGLWIEKDPISPWKWKRM